MEGGLKSIQKEGQATQRLFDKASLKNYIYISPLGLTMFSRKVIDYLTKTPVSPGSVGAHL